MEIVMANLAGFCFGVERAVNNVYSLINQNNQINTHIYTLGKLIHNPIFLEELKTKGVFNIDMDRIDDIYKKSNQECKNIIVIRTHGITKKLNDKLLEYQSKNDNFKVVDCTCPYVKKIHHIVYEHSNLENNLIILGDKNHPEVEGICSYAKGTVKVFSDSIQLDEYLNASTKVKNLIMVAQTTQNLLEWKKCQEIIKKVYTNALIFDTICSVTENRQVEVDKLSKYMDMMLIIGGKDSSNTNKLFTISKQNQKLSFFIEASSEIPFEYVTPQMKVGITAGASTPRSIIEEVKNIMGELSFAEMLEESLKTLNTGETVKGVITSISQNEIHVDLGTKVTGILAYSEITDDPSAKLDELYKVGDEIVAVVVKVSDLEGVATLSKKRIDSVNNWQNIVKAFEDGTILQGKIIDIVKGGVIILINAIKIFIPASQTTIPKDADLRTLVGTIQKVKIIDINDQRRRAVASVRIIVREERKIKEDAFWAIIEKDKKYEGIVKSITSYGAFVDLGGVDGMVHSSELSWRRIKHPSEIVSLGDKVQVYVKDFDRETRRISLGYKTEEMDPWNIFNAKYKIGDTASVKIVSMMPFGAFAEILPGADGLIHISQIAAKKISQPADVLEVGQIVDAKIIDIDPESHKISLSIKALIAPIEVAPTEEVIE